MNAKHEKTLSGQQVFGPIYEPTRSLKTKQTCYTVVVRW